jgi:hypothetical protein
MPRNRPPPTPDDAANTRNVKHLRRLSWLLDNCIPLPGGYRIGFDGIIGLVPGLGDAVGASLSTYILVQAARLGASPVQLLRMMVNILVETVVGVIPVVGDLFDFAWKANERNMVILDAQLRKAPARGSAKARLTIASILLLIGYVLILLLLIVLGVKLVLALVSALSG